MKSKSTNSTSELKDERSYVISYFFLRRSVGILGLALPFALVIGSVVAGCYDSIQDSVSSYYYTNMRNIFVGVLCAVALFLFSYRGYDYRDNVAGNLACIFALGVALFPCTPLHPLPGDKIIIGKIHFISASLLFLTFSYFSLVLFTQTDKKKISWRKKMRNRIYRVCGYSMLGSIFLIAIYFLFMEGKYPELDQAHPVFWLETTALVSFGISWLVKGQALLRDANQEEESVQEDSATSV